MAPNAKMLEQKDWEIRLFVYRFFTSRGYPPGVQEIARHFQMAVPDVREAVHRLHDAHALFLRPSSDDILMANPLSAVATDYQVTVAGRRLYANCAWDALGIPAMLHADARIEARHPLDRVLLRFSIDGGRLSSESRGLVHFAKPFRDWYDNLIDT